MKVVLATLFALALLAAPAAGNGALQRAKLTLLDSGTPALRGTGFQHAERVRVQILAGTRQATRRTTAGVAGGFTLTLGSMAPSDCGGFSAVAVGSDGSRATYKRAPGVCAAP